jgi:hypothetical protein
MPVDRTRGGWIVTDFVYYPGESSSASNSIVGTSAQVTINGPPSTQSKPPDGTALTLLGVPQADFKTSFRSTLNSARLQCREGGTGRIPAGSR